jgi:hypothetical protein
MLTRRLGDLKSKKNQWVPDVISVKGVRRTLWENSSLVLIQRLDLKCKRTNGFLLQARQMGEMNPLKEQA